MKRSKNAAKRFIALDYPLKTQKISYFANFEKNVFLKILDFSFMKRSKNVANRFSALDYPLKTHFFQEKHVFEKHVFFKNFAVPHLKTPFLSFLRPNNALEMVKTRFWAST